MRATTTTGPSQLIISAPPAGAHRGCRRPRGTARRRPRSCPPLAVLKPGRLDRAAARPQLIDAFLPAEVGGAGRPFEGREPCRRGAREAEGVGLWGSERTTRRAVAAVMQAYRAGRGVPGGGSHHRRHGQAQPNPTGADVAVVGRTRQPLRGRCRTRPRRPRSVVLPLPTRRGLPPQFRHRAPAAADV